MIQTPDEPIDEISGEHLIQQSADLDAALEADPDVAGLRKLIDDTRASQVRINHLNRLFLVVAAIAIVIAVIASFVAIRVDHNAREIARANTFAEADATNLRVLCEKGNEDNAKRKALWTFVIDALTTSGTPNDFLVGLTQLVDQAYAQADCNPAQSAAPGSTGP